MGPSLRSVDKFLIKPVSRGFFRHNIHMAFSDSSLWQQCVDQLAQELPEQQFNTWIKPLVAQVSDDFTRVTVFVGNRFKLDWVRAQYAGKIAALLERLYGQPVQVELALAQRDAPARTYLAPAQAEVPMPAEPNMYLPGFALSSAMNSCRLFTPVLGCATRNSDERPTRATLRRRRYRSRRRQRFCRSTRRLVWKPG